MEGQLVGGLRLSPSAGLGTVPQVLYPVTTSIEWLLPQEKATAETLFEGCI
jgi:hypothetical protein